MKAVLLAKDFGKMAESGECIVVADRNTQDGAIRDKDDSSDGIDVFLDLGDNIPLVEAVLLNTQSVGQVCRGREPWSEVTRFSMFETAKSRHYAVCARKFVKRRRVRLALVFSYEYCCQQGHHQLARGLRTFLHQSLLQEGQYIAILLCF